MSKWVVRKGDKFLTMRLNTRGRTPAEIYQFSFGPESLAYRWNSYEEADEAYNQALENNRELDGGGYAEEEGAQRMPSGMNAAGEGAPSQTCASCGRLLEPAYTFKHNGFTLCGGCETAYKSLRGKAKALTTKNLIFFASKAGGTIGSPSRGKKAGMGAGATGDDNIHSALLTYGYFREAGSGGKYLPKYSNASGHTAHVEGTRVYHHGPNGEAIAMSEGAKETVENLRKIHGSHYTGRGPSRGKKAGMGSAYAPLSALPADLQPQVAAQMQTEGKNPDGYVYRLLCKRGKNGVECKRIE